MVEIQHRKKELAICMNIPTYHHSDKNYVIEDQPEWMGLVCKPNILQNCTL